MSSFDMPAKREFRVIPSPQSVAKLVIRSIVFIVLAGTLLFAAKMLWSYTFGGRSEVQAATPPAPAKSVAQQILQKHEAASAAAAVAPQLTDEQFERLRADVCLSLGKSFAFEDGHCFKRKPPTWSGEGIGERGAPTGEGIKKFFGMFPGAAAPAEETEEAPPPPPQPAPREHAVSRMADESGSWRPQLRLLHEPGEPCPGGGHRDEMGLGCKFTDEERAELRRRRY